MRRPVADAHPSEQLRGNPFRVDHGFIRRHIEMEVRLVDASERPEVRTKRRPRPFTGVAVPLTATIAISISRPLASAVADGGMARMAPPIALPLVGVEPRAASRDVFRNQCGAGAGVGMVAPPKALLPRRTRDHTDDGGPITGRGPVPFALVGTPTGRIGGIAMGRAFFPPHSDPAHPPQRPYRSARRSAQSR
jgi:hypothetical protein